MKAIWNNQVIAESSDTVIVEGNHYFPPASVDHNYIQSSDLHTTCPYKGVASYYTLIVDGAENKDAAWYYPSTRSGFEKIAGYVAFWRGVEVTD